MPRNEWHMWSDFIGLFVATGYVKDEIAQSLLLVGDPGTGKSTILRRFFQVPSVIVAMDATAEGLKQQVFKRAIKEGKRHLMLPEMYKLMQRRGPTADNTIGVLTLAMSREMHDSFIGDKQLDEFPPDFQLGVIGAMPSKVFEDWKQTINNTGLLSRMYPVPFKFSERMAVQIHVAIAQRDTSLLAPVRFAWPHRPVEISYSSRLAPDIIRIAKEFKDTQGQHNRLLNLFVSLTKAATLLEGQHVCQRKHVDMVAQFIPILRGDKPR